MTTWDSITVACLAAIAVYYGGFSVLILLAVLEWRSTLAAQAARRD